MLARECQPPLWDISASRGEEAPPPPASLQHLHRRRGGGEGTGSDVGGERGGGGPDPANTTFHFKPPVLAGVVLRDHPGMHLLESEEVKLLGVRARPLAHDALLRPGRLYFLVALPRPAAPLVVRRVPRRCTGAARSLMLTRRSSSDLSLPASAAMTPASPLSTASEGGPVRLRMRLPKAQVEKLMAESRDNAEAARIMQLCVANAGSGAAMPERGEREAAAFGWEGRRRRRGEGVWPRRGDGTTGGRARQCRAVPSPSP